MIPVRFLSIAPALIAALFVAALSGCSTRPSTAPVERVRSDAFGRLPDGREVRIHTLRNRSGMELRAMDLGATITHILAPDRMGQLTNVLLGSDSLEAYQKGFPGAASTIGRFANRIRNARFPLDGREVRVTANAGEHHIHGGKEGFASKLWAATTGVRPTESFVRFQRRSPAGEEGFPGNLDVSVTFTLTDSNEVRLDYEATTDEPTVVNLTNHAYFNLAGTGDVLAQQLQIPAERYTVTDKALIPTGPDAPVAGTGLDFRQPHAIGERIAQYYNGPNGYDHNFVLRDAPGRLQLAARVIDPQSGRQMECLTTEPGVQLYTANHFGGRPSDPATWGRHPAFCLETQHKPDAPNHPDFASTTLRPGRKFHSTTIYRFTVNR
jgi:aldose 1-epimerase